MRECGPNVVHDAIARLVDFFNSTGKNGCVITQNPDGFDRASSLGGEVFEINGNLDYMSCSKECSAELYPSILGSASIINKVPTCPKCGALCRPHMLLFDESYNEEYYRAKTAAKMMESIDVLIILGT